VEEFYQSTGCPFSSRHDNGVVLEGDESTNPSAATNISNIRIVIINTLYLNESGEQRSAQKTTNLEENKNLFFKSYVFIDAKSFT
jgi:hypothetical protein